MVAALDQLSVVEHEDVIAGHHAGEPVGHDQRRAAGHQAVERLLNGGLVLSVDAGERLVEDQDWGIAQQRAGDRDALALAAGEAVAALADRRLVALGQVADELVGVGGLRGGDDLLVGGVGPAEAQVVQDGAVEEVGVLHHDGHLLADVDEAERVEVATAEPDLALLRRVHPLEQPEQRRFARA